MAKLPIGTELLYLNGDRIRITGTVPEQRAVAAEFRVILAVWWVHRDLSHIREADFDAVYV